MTAVAATSPLCARCHGTGFVACTACDGTGALRYDVPSDVTPGASYPHVTACLACDDGRVECTCYAGRDAEDEIPW